MTWTTPDLCDQFRDVQVAEPVFRSFGGQARFAGPAVTVHCLNDNSRVRELAATPGETVSRQALAGSSSGSVVVLS